MENEECKDCCECKESLLLSEFRLYVQKEKKYYSKICKKCYKDKNKNKRQITIKNYYLRNKENLNKKGKKWRDNKREEREREREKYREDNKEKIEEEIKIKQLNIKKIRKEKAREYYFKNKTKIDNQQKINRENRKKKREEEIENYKENNKEKIEEEKRIKYKNRKIKKKLYLKNYYEKNKEVATINSHERYLKNKEEIKQYNKEYRKVNKENINKQVKERRKIPEVAEQIRKRRKERLKSDPKFRIRKSISDRIRQELKYKGQRKSYMTLKYVDCTLDFLKSYLEVQFREGMNWDNYGSVWHVDHIIPITYFDLLNIKEHVKAFHYSNLQPLFVKENLSKTNHIYPYILEREWNGRMWIKIIDKITSKT